MLDVLPWQELLPAQLYKRIRNNNKIYILNDPNFHIDLGLFVAHSVRV